MVLWILIILAVFIWVSNIFLKKRFNYWKQINVYSEPTEYFFGNSKEVVLKKNGLGPHLASVHMNFRNLSKAFGGYYFFTRPFLIPVDLDLIQDIMVTKFDCFTDRVFHNHESDPFSSHLVALKGLEWKNLRSKLSPTFTPAKLKMMFQLITKSLCNFTNFLDKSCNEEPCIEIKEKVSRLSMDVIALCFFAAQTDCIKNDKSEFITHTKRCFNPTITDSFIRLLMILAPMVLNVFRIKSIPAQSGEYFVKLVEDTIKYREGNHTKPNDFLQLLLQLKSDTSNTSTSFSTTRIAAQCLFFLIAGYEATSSTVSYCLFEMAKNQEIQRKAREEIARIVGMNNQISYDEIENLGYINKCVKETFRKHPPTPFVFRECTKTYKVPNHNVVIEKGVGVFVSLTGIHNDPALYPNPEEFDPERFSEENQKTRHPCSFLPFGCGPRNCIARNFGLMQVKATLVTLLQKYEFQLDAKTKLPLREDVTSLVLRPRDGIWLNIKAL